MKGDTKSSKKKIENEVRQDNLEGVLSELREAIDNFESEEPKISISIDKKKVVNYNQALEGLLELRSGEERQKRGY